ncbi:MAG TPA: hypothetical protein VF765_31865 [Polyangiaceae bacterium]
MQRLVLAGIVTLTACTRQAPTATSGGDASAPGRQSVRVPGALSLSRGLDTLSVSIDPASLADTQVTVDPGMTLGIESETMVFPVGRQPPETGRKAYTSGATFSLGTSTWNTRTDGIPVQGTRYVTEMRLVLFETDVPAQHEWDPHAGRYKALWTRTLRQAEE